MSEIGVFLVPLLVVNILLGFGLARLYDLRKQAAQRKAAKPANLPAPPPDTRCLSRLDQELKNHTQAIQAFSGDIAATPDHALRGALERTAPPVQEANALVRRRLDETAVELCQLGLRMHHTVAESVMRIGYHRQQIGNFDDLLGVIQQMQAPDQIKSQIAGTVQSLIDSNQNLQTALVDTQHRLNVEHTYLSQAAEEARRDFLTQLPNRRAFDERLREFQSMFERHGDVYVLAMIDVDFFKRFNDEHGHATGDVVLATVARILANRKRATDHAFRFGGEEFAILMPKLSLDAGLIVADDYRRLVQDGKLIHGGKEFRVTVSVGVAEIQPNETADQLLARSDAALYAAKRAGRNCTRASEPAAARETQQVGME